MAITTFTAAQVLTAAQMNAVQSNDFNQTVSTKTASYTLVAADKGTRIAMNSASATTITVNDSLFTAGDTLELLNISTGVCTVTAGTATVSSAGSLAIPANGGGTLFFTSAGVSIFFPTAVTQSASGLTCVKAETAFTTASSFFADTIFTSTFTNYLIKIIYTNTTQDALRFKLRASATATSTNYNRQTLVALDTALTGARGSALTSFEVALDTNGNFSSSIDINLFAPQLAQITAISGYNGVQFRGAATTPGIFITSGNQNSATQFDGFELSVAAGTMTGVYAVYGYSKAV